MNAKELFNTIKSRLYLSFSILVLISIINGVITLVVLNKNENLSNEISTIIDPATNSLIELNNLLIETKMLSTNWVFIRSNNRDKEALLNIYSTRYPQLRKKLNELSPLIFNQTVSDSLKKVYDEFDKLILVQKEIIETLNSYESYDDAFTRMRMETIIEDEIIPKTAALTETLNHVMVAEKAIRIKAHQNLEESSLTLSYVLIGLVLLVVCIGILFSIYLVKIITNPIHQLYCIINDMGRGKLKTITYGNTRNEIGLMVSSVNNLSAGLKASADFATEIGKRNFSIDFKPLGEEDILGKALITMRDNLKESDSLLNQAQSIAKLGSWEFDLITKTANWSDELFSILGFTPGQVVPGLGIFMELVSEDEKPKLKQLLAKGINEKAFNIECKVLTHHNILKNLYIEGKPEQDAENSYTKIVGIVQDITIQKKSELELQKNNAELVKTNKELDKFVYSVSHDLRAPLSSMLGMVQLTQDDCEDPIIKENLGLVKGSILKLDGFIQDILAYSRNSRLDVKKDEILFNHLLTDISGNLKHMAGINSNVKIYTQVTQASTFKSDNSRLSIVLNNLVSNAIRYRNPDQKESFVKVDVEVNETSAQIMVADNGIGIKKELHQKVFDMFYRVSENSVGSGLGLYIVKETVEKLKGKIQIESKPGVGTKFLIAIPNLN